MAIIDSIEAPITIYVYVNGASTKSLSANLLSEANYYDDDRYPRNPPF